ncbi:hypothetical protein THRCLA_04333 [Thraustotheca clavata]|uniref:BCNT-C domain-containing protein n=1 Tax=Thraustotheca clavata TaxID=74557 RepID=A0A1V9ZZC9_9STRA|nr:hypothetical protein THRCLA_04333 [Thraustotheca clavata]
MSKKNEHDLMDAEEDSADELYDPEEDLEAKAEDELDAKEENEYLRKQSKEPQKIGEKRKIDSVWEELNAESTVSSTSNEKSKKLLQKLGREPREKKKKKVYEFKMPIMGCSGKSKGNVPVKSTEKVTKVMKFAGKEYTMEAQAPIKKTGLDAVVDALQQPKKISTIEKSSMDWDSFKEKEGIADELEQYTKNGYLDKKDFLNRVDLRKFEIEKAEREKLRRAQS